MRRESLLSALINACLSALFFVVVFGTSGPVTVPGAGNLAFDFLPQSAAIGLMASLMPSLVTRRAILAGKCAGTDRAPSRSQIVKRALRNALVAAILGVLIGTLLGWRGPDVLPYGPTLAVKVLYGAALGSIITRFELRQMLN